MLLSDLLGLAIVDIRDRLPHRDWIIGTLPAYPTSLTYHYNGPAVAPERQYGAGLIAQLISDSNWQMRAGWGGTKNGAPHLMYHLVFASDGTIYQTADLTEQLWHCAHADGNSHGLAFHCPIGDKQTPSPAMLASLLRATDLVCRVTGMPRTRVLGHLEWKHATLCPGPNLMRELLSYRAGQRAATPVAPALPEGIQTFAIRRSFTLPVRIRQTPHLDAAVTGRYKAGTIVYVDQFANGDGVNRSTLMADPRGDTRWVRLARIPNHQADLGWLSMAVLEAA